MEGIQYIALGLMSIAMLGSALGISKVFSSALDAVSRNPEADDKLSKYAFVGAGLAESIGIFALVICLLILFG